MVMGTYGPLVFQCSARRTMMPQNISGNWKGRWSSAETPGKVPQSEFLGPDIPSLSLDIVFKADMGIRPEAQLKTLRSMVENGVYYPLIMGGRPVGKLPWAIKSVSESWDVLTSRGKIYSATVTINLEGYR